jgi:RNA polymerase sigma-70 factor (ECF subfamily)
MTQDGNNARDHETGLVKSASAGDAAAFERLVRLYSARMIDYCRRMVGRSGPAEDLAQEVFVKFYLALPRFEIGRPVSPLLYRIAHNHCTDFLRRRRLPTVALVREDPEGGVAREADHPSPDPDPESLALRAEVQDAVQQALDDLPDAYRSALVLYHREGLGYAEICEALDLPMGTVKARIHRGREKLQQKLAGLVVT